MRATEEYRKWCALERQWEESRFSPQQEKAYVTGFNRAIALMETLLKERQHETITSISPTSSNRTTQERSQATFNRH